MHNSADLLNILILRLRLGIQQRLQQTEVLRNTALSVTQWRDSKPAQSIYAFLHTPFHPLTTVPQLSDSLNGWQFLLLLQMLLITPVMGVYLFNHDVQQYHVLNDAFAWQSYAILLLLIVLACCSLSVWGGIELLRKREWSVVQRAASILWLTGPITVLIARMMIPLLIFDTLAPGQSLFAIIMYFSVSLLLAAAWTVFFVQSTPVRAAYHAPSVTHAPETTTAPIQPTQNTKLIIGAKVPFYMLILFALILYAILKYHHRHASAPSTARSALSNTTVNTVTPKQASVEVAYAPQMAIGDTYVLASIDYHHPARNHKTKRTVTTVGPDSFDLSIVNLNSKIGKARLLRFDHHWNLIATRNADHSGNNYAPALKYYDFPLFPGKTWTQKSQEKNIKTGHVREHTLSGTVGAWEEISVPAGTFHAIKVSLNTLLYDPKTHVSTEGTDVSWFAPAVKRSVKSETSLRYAKENTEYSELQLQRFTVH